VEKRLCQRPRYCVTGGDFQLLPVLNGILSGPVRVPFAIGPREVVSVSVEGIRAKEGEARVGRAHAAKSRHGFGIDDRRGVPLMKVSSSAPTSIRWCAA